MANILPAVTTTVGKSIGGFFKNNWIEIVTTIASLSVGGTAMSKAERLFEVLTIDNLDLDGLYYIDIS